jgi:hypothetical protein
LPTTVQDSTKNKKQCNISNVVKEYSQGKINEGQLEAKLNKLDIPINEDISRHVSRKDNSPCTDGWVCVTQGDWAKSAESYEG